MQRILGEAVPDVLLDRILADLEATTAIDDPAGRSWNDGTITGREPIRSVPLNPLAIVLLLALQWVALYQKWAGRPQTWRGRSYPAGG